MDNKNSNKQIGKKAVKKVAVKKITKKASSSTAITKLFDSIEAKISKARKNREASVNVFSTKRSHYKKNLAGTSGFGSNDLKEPYLTVYKKLICKYGVDTIPVNVAELEVDWVVKFN